MKKYILALDEGTTSARTILFDKKGNIVSIAQQEFNQIYPQPGYVEHDPMEIYSAQYASLTQCITKADISPCEIAGIGITNQRETTVVWDKNTGKPIYNAIVWQCRRTADICEKLIADGYGDYITATTGLKADAYFSGTKIKWILDHVEGAREKAQRGDLLFGTIDTWLVWKLTDGKVYITDRTNASRTMLYNIKENCWDKKLLSILDIPESMLPKVCSSSEVYAHIELMGEEIPVCGIAGDQQAALFGQGCFNSGDVKTTYGTGCFLLANTGTTPIFSKNGLITTIAATAQNEAIEFALEGSVFIGGAVIQWIRDELELISDAKDSEYFASKVKDTAGVYIVPAFAGLGAPYWDMHARGTITGLTRGAGRNHIIRAALEAIAYQTNDVISAIKADMDGNIKRLKVDGGASSNNLLMQFQSDISNLTIFRPEINEATAAGAAFLAGLAVGFFKDKDEISNLINNGKSFAPAMDKDKRSTLLKGWQNAVKACQTFR